MASFYAVPTVLAGVGLITHSPAFWVHFFLAGICFNVFGFGLCYLLWAAEQRIKGRSYFWHATIALLVINGGLALIVGLVA